MVEYVLVTNYEKCTGCRICELVCSTHKSQVVNPLKSTISIVNLRDEASAVSIPVRCMQCENPICEAVCPVGAISTDPVTGSRVVDKKACIGCKACVYACPFGAVTVDRSVKTVSICDLCDGDPLCARWCPFGAIQYIRSDEVSIRLKRDRANNLLNFSGFLR